MRYNSEKSIYSGGSRRRLRKPVLFSYNLPSRGIHRKRCSEYTQQIYRRTPMPKCDFNKVAIEITLRHGCSPVNLLHGFITPFYKNTSGVLLLGQLE